VFLSNSDARHRRRRRVSTGLECGRRPAAGAHYPGATREEDSPPAGHRRDSEHTTAPGPVERGPASTGRPDGLRRRKTAPPHRPLARAGRTAGAGRDAEAVPRSRIDSYTNLNNESLPLSRLAPGDQAGGVGPHPQSTRLRAQAGRVPPPAQRRLGTRRSTSQGRTRLVTGWPTRGRRATPAVNQTVASDGPRRK
jgi:hypothetical protein